MIGPDTVIRTVLLHAYVLILRVISRVLSLDQLRDPRGWGYHGRGRIIELMCRAAIYADPEVAPKARMLMDEVRRSRETRNR